MWHCWWCGEMTLAYYEDFWSSLCPECQDEFADNQWTTVVRLLEALGG